MQQDLSKVIFLLCDDDARQLDFNRELLEGLLRRTFNIFSPEIHPFDDGDGVLKFLEDRKSAKGVVLISDQVMDRMRGSELFRALDAKGLLPENTFLCSSMPREDFQALVDYDLGIDNAEKKIKFLPKNGVGYHFNQNLPQAIQAAAREIGLDVAPSRPEGAVVAPSDRCRS